MEFAEPEAEEEPTVGILPRERRPGADIVRVVGGRLA